MSRIYLNLTILFFVLFLLQVGVFGSVHLLGVATPVVFVYFILKLPVEMNRNVVILLAAFGGLLVDFFSYTLGLNMLALTIVGFLRYYMLKLFGPREAFENMQPSIASFGKVRFFIYSGVLLFLNLSVLFGVEYLTLFNPFRLTLQVLSSFSLSLLIISGFEILYQGIEKK
jgi:rod shape-determining protein MreD